MNSNVSIPNPEKALEFNFYCFLFFFFCSPFHNEVPSLGHHDLFAVSHNLNQTIKVCIISQGANAFKVGFDYSVFQITQSDQFKIRIQRTNTSFRSMYKVYTPFFFTSLYLTISWSTIAENKSKQLTVIKSCYQCRKRLVSAFFWTVEWMNKWTES